MKVKLKFLNVGSCCFDLEFIDLLSFNIFVSQSIILMFMFEVITNFHL